MNPTHSLTLNPTTKQTLFIFYVHDKQKARVNFFRSDYNGNPKIIVSIDFVEFTCLYLMNYIFRSSATIRSRID